MNKRNTEGFVLAYVMIVIAVVSAITMALTTSTLNVLKAQEQSVVRMQNKYEAMGVLELFLAETESACLKQKADDFDSINDALSSSKDACIQSFVNTINTLSQDDSLPTKIKLVDSSVNSDFSNQFVVESITSSTDSRDVKFKISATYEFDFDDVCFLPEIAPYSDTIDNPNYQVGGTQPEKLSVTKYKYQIASVKLNCTSYEITSIGGAA